ncbi:solute carrier family 22 member 14 [Echinops telfairi]|uniref:Solute carrier family 22 member 14 n=1 Tax=Echinops telfairi TaxID=9371 RepID=A0AC55DGQ4_ECHTE|nr:solute carrier family 22 member 14 [Echinops telfairi]
MDGTYVKDKFVGILHAVGGFGNFQRRLVALTFIPNMMSAFFMVADTFVFAAQKAYCNTSWILTVGPNLSEAEQLNLTLPREPNGSFLTCLQYSPVDWDLDSITQFGLNHTEICYNGWIYPESKKRLVTEEFDLVCGQEPPRVLVLAVYMAGLLLGSITFGLLCDRLGRYCTSLLSLLGLLVFGFGTAFVNSLNVYLFFRFGACQAVAGYTISSLSLITEWLVSEHRVRVVILSHCCFAVGLLFLSALAYSLPHWRLLFLVGGVPAFSFIPYIWILPESPRWLLLRGKVEEAKQVLSYAASLNKQIIPFSMLRKLQLPNKQVTKTSVLDLCSNRYICQVILVMSIIWFTISYSYLTLNLKVGDFGLNPYARLIVSSLLEVPVRLCCILLLELIGRKWTLAITLLFGSLMCLLSLLISQELKFMVLSIILLGEVSLANSVTLVFNYTAELLPTTLRATGLGVLSLPLMIGAVLALMALLVRQRLALLPILLSFSLASLAMYLCCLLPELQDGLFSDKEHVPELLSLQKDINLESCVDPANVLTEDSSSEDVSEEAAKNAILNARPLKVRPEAFSTLPKQPIDKAGNAPNN